MSELKSEVILEFLGIKSDEAKSVEDFKKKFEAEFARKDLYKDQLLQDKDFTGKIFGQRVGSIENNFKSHVKKMGIEIDEAEIKDKKTEEIQEIILKKIAETNKKAMDEVEKTFKGSKDEQVKQWQEKYQTVEGKLRDTEGLLKKTSEDFEGYKKDSANKFKTQTLDRYKNEVIGKIKFKQNASDLEKRGFLTLINDKYDFDLDEKDQFFVKDKKTNQRIPSAKVTGQFKTPDEILNEELISNKLAEINPNGGQRVYVNNPAPQSVQAEAKNPMKFPARFTTARQ